MTYLPEATIFETKDGIQWKTYSSSHPDDRIIARPKYIPQDKVRPHGLVSRFLFGRQLTRFNPFAPAKYLKPFLRQFKKYYPQYFYRSPLHKHLFFSVPKKNISRIYDMKSGTKTIFESETKSLDPYLKLVKGLLLFLAKSGAGENCIGLTNSTLLGNYTFGKSDIDIIIFGKKNGWKVLKFLERAKHPLLRWKSKKEWGRYYDIHKTSTNFTKEDFIAHNLRKRNEGIFGGHVFTIFTVENRNELWSKWGEEKYQPLGNAKIRALVTEELNSLVRPAQYKIKNAEIKNFSGRNNGGLPLTQIVTYSIPYLLQAKKGEVIEAAGLLEKVIPKKGRPFLRLVVEYPEVIAGSKTSSGYIKTIFKR
ncbi:MAG: hypothetical protein KGJ89_03720 [Patescibacteria group bacterium]|nr:hypothetical protein [Patescibacteria group bacterium]MDE2015232.1 hypothetical protein [Patescibacteria group bacterium]MDE2227038.1 hypothetical protein [Patescibacteria group bacterium]